MRKNKFLLLVLSFLLCLTQYSQALRPEFVNRTEFETEFKNKYDAITGLQGAEKLEALKVLYTEIKTWIKDKEFPRATRDRLYRSMLNLNHLIAWEEFQSCDLNSAKNYLEECLEIIKGLEDAKLDNQEIYAQLQLSEIMRILGNEPESERLLSEVAKHDLKANKRYQAFLDLGKAKLLISKGQFSDAEALIAKANIVFLANSSERADLKYEVESTKLLLDQKLGRRSSDTKSLEEASKIIEADAQKQKNSNYELWITRQIQLGEVKLSQAQTLLSSYTLDSAFEMTKKAYEFFSQKDKNTQEMINIRGIGDCGILFGEIYQLQGNIDLCSKTIDGYIKFLSKYKGYNSQKAQLHLIAGKNALSLGNTKSSETSLNEAVKLLSGNIDNGLQSKLNRFKADVNRFKGQYGIALSALTDAIEIANKGGYIREEMNSLIDLGDIFLIVGNIDASLNNFNQALSIAKKIDNKPEIIICQLRRVKAYIEKGDDASLRSALDILIEIEPESKKLQMLKVKAEVHDFIAQLYSILGKDDKSVIYCKQAISFLESTYPAYKLQLTVDLGKYLRNSGNTEEAAKILQEAYSSAANKFSNPFFMHQVLIEFALTEEKLNNIERAYQLYTKATETAEQVRTEILDRENKALLYSKNRILFEKLVEIAVKLKKYDKAFEWSESGKARAFVDKLSEVQNGLNLNLDEALKVQASTIIETLASLNKSLQSELAQPLPDEKRIVSIKNSINTLTQEYQKNQNKILASAPEFSALVKPKIASVGDVQKALETNSVFLSYYLCDNSSFLFEITKSTFKVHEIPLSEQIEPLVKYHRDLIISGARITLDEFYESSTKLGSMLLGNVKPALSVNADIIIAPSGILHYLPFETLSIGTMPENIQHFWSSIPYLISRVNSVSYIQSATVMLLMINKNNGAKIKSDFVAFGDPIFPYEFEKLNNKLAEIGRKSERSIFGNIFPPLPNTGREVSEIAGLFKDEKSVKVFLREDANENNFDSMISDAKYVHIATHGILSEENPSFSGLILSTNPESKEDGFCYLIEIYNMKLSAELVVLSACQTGLGKIIKGEGLEGLSRAFMYAGAKRLVVSLWSVDDASTADFMQDFYKTHLKTGESVTSALAQAKKSMINSKKYSAPYYWSPFIFIGDYKKIKTN